MVEVVQVVRTGESSVRLTFRHSDGRVDEQIVFDSQAEELRLADEGLGRPFNADGKLFRSVAEARRIQLAYLFDPRLAVHVSQIEPLPHQIKAVYGDMLSRQPLRYLLADDPGSGKTIMAGLLIKELMLRGDLQRCLVVAPGSLVGQWQDEMWDRFNLEFHVLTTADVQAARDALGLHTVPIRVRRTASRRNEQAPAGRTVTRAFPTHVGRLRAQVNCS